MLQYLLQRIDGFKSVATDEITEQTLGFLEYIIRDLIQQRI